MLYNRYIVLKDVRSLEINFSRAVEASLLE